MEAGNTAATGIELLKTLDRVLIREQSGSYVNNKYVVLTAEGAVLLYAKEDSGILNRVLVGKSRAFEIDVFDTNDKEVIKIRRPYTVGPDKMDVALCGQAAAVVRKEVTFFKPVLSINDVNDHPVVRVKGPVSISSECNFELYSTDKKRIGDIGKRWSGLARAPAADRDSFAIRFPVDLDVRYKAAIISTCFLIDFLFYEN
ncbi:phospholipid scramblase 3-like [Vanessa tameamea]|uniref:Phospholipid scramblase n=1 Tax=Vanessa tameamea TaxID=334116 RepID=A0A8B8I8W5_VANTA|nr:phospholipid scramblase 3-like [Vanessa tameamea]XP_047531228.1 phospholipid scramblase 3-like [Vanessa atalanta]